jgi:hypothetical protein
LAVFYYLAALTLMLIKITNHTVGKANTDQ